MRSRQDLSKPSEKSAMLKTAPLTCEQKGSLRVKRPDPWHWANALPKAVADPALNGQDADLKSQSCLELVRKPVAQPSAQAS